MSAKMITRACPCILGHLKESFFFGCVFYSHSKIIVVQSNTPYYLKKLIIWRETRKKHWKDQKARFRGEKARFRAPHSRWAPRCRGYAALEITSFLRLNAQPRMNAGFLCWCLLLRFWMRAFSADAFCFVAALASVLTCVFAVARACSACEYPPQVKWCSVILLQEARESPSEPGLEVMRHM